VTRLSASHSSEKIEKTQSKIMAFPGWTNSSARGDYPAATPGKTEAILTEYEPTPGAPGQSWPFLVNPQQIERSFGQSAPTFPTIATVTPVRQYQARTEQTLVLSGVLLSGWLAKRSPQPKLAVTVFCGSWSHHTYM
jgi:hypothetical protein